MFGVLVEELERRQVRLGWDAVILIGEWDSFYGRALPIEFRAAACAKIATFSEADLEEIQVPVDIKERCRTVPNAIDLQIQHPADYESLRLNVQRYSYLSGLDGEVPSDDSVIAGRGDKTKAGTRLRTPNESVRKEPASSTTCGRSWRAFRMKEKARGQLGFWAPIYTIRCSLSKRSAHRFPTRFSLPSISMRATSTRANTNRHVIIW